MGFCWKKIRKILLFETNIGSLHPQKQNMQPKIWSQDENIWSLRMLCRDQVAKIQSMVITQKTKQKHDHKKSCQNLRKQKQKKNQKKEQWQQLTSHW